LDELAPVWRRDLPMPAALASLAAGPAEVRAALAAALAGRRGADASAALAKLLVDAELSVRRAAAAALFRSFGDAIPYDPLAPESERTRAAARLRALHNRRP